MADIRERIKKLLALATSPNENEARDAMLKARELMAKHKLSEDEFNKEEAKLVHSLCKDISWTTDSGKIWMVRLCELIAENYVCTASWATPRNTRTHTLMITGFEEDVNICKEVIKYAIGFIESKFRILTLGQTTQKAKTTMDSYAKGFIMGLEFAFEMQKDEHPEWGLVLVKSKELSEYEETLGQRKVRTKKTDFDPLAYMKGQKDGENFNAKRVLTTEA